MIFIKEKHNGNEVFFEVNYQENGKTINSNEIYFRTAVIDKDENTYLMLYNRDMEPISSVFSFLNFGCSSQ